MVYNKIGVTQLAQHYKLAPAFHQCLCRKTQGRFGSRYELVLASVLPIILQQDCTYALYDGTSAAGSENATNNQNQRQSSS